MQKIILLIIFFTFQISLLKSDENYYLMLKNNKVNVRYGPSFDYPIKFIYKKKFLPIKIIDKKENFRKTLDFKKNSGWIHISQMKKISSLIILQDQIMYKKPSTFSRPIAKIRKGRLLIINKCKKNWCKVNSEDMTGWIDAFNVWGKIN